jgi:hypothetical protein
MTPLGWQPNAKSTHVWAVIRLDEFQPDGTPLEDRVTITKIVWDEVAAASEVDRLNALRSPDDGVRYVARITRLIRPEGGP